MIDVYWAKANPDRNVTTKGNGLDLLVYEPISLLKEIKELYKENASFESWFQCPSAVKFLSDFYVIKSPVDLYLDLSDKDNVWMPPTKGQEKRNQKWFNENITVRSTSEEGKLIFFLWFYVFYANKPLQINSFPPFLHENEYNRKTFNLGGGLDINKWFRPIHSSFYVSNDVKELTIKRGDPLLYIQFNTEETLNFTQFNMNEKLHDYTDSCVKLKDHRPKMSLKFLYNLFMKNKYDKLVLEEIKKNLIDA